MSFILKIIKIILVFVIILVSWVFARHYLPENVANHPVALTVNELITEVGKFILPVADSKFISIMINKVDPPDYNRLIRTVSAKQIASLIHRRMKNKKDNSLIVFIYNTKFADQTIMFNDLNDLSAERPDDKSLVIMAVATSISKEKLVPYLDDVERGVTFKPLLLNDGEDDKLAQYLDSIGINYKTPPFFMTMDKAGNTQVFNLDSYIGGNIQQWVE